MNAARNDGPPARAETNDEPLTDVADGAGWQSVVRIYATSQSPDYENPWQSEAPVSATGSGVVVDAKLPAVGGYVLTGAHVIADATFLQVQKVSDPNKFTARVEAVCHDSDLALLFVEDPAFMQGVEAEQLGELPRLRDHVSVVGYPVGGEEISITEGVVSRIEVQRYSHSERSMLAVTVDAAINEGNSGGPVFLDSRVAGIAFQTLQDAENIGEMVPSTLIEQFLSSVRNGKPTAIPGLGVSAQRLENPALRARVGLSGNQTGVLIIAVEHGGSACGVLKKGDALLSLAGHPIANNGTIRYRDQFRTSFEVLLGDHHVGDEVNIEYYRDGKVQQARVTLGRFASLVRRSQYEATPTYFVYGGLVFQTLSLDFLRTWSTWWEKAPAELLSAYYNGTRTERIHEVVVITQVLAHDINVGYEDARYSVVAAVNGTCPRDLKHLVELIEGAETWLDLTTSDQFVLTFDVHAAKVAGPVLLDRYRVPYDRWAGLRP